MLNFRTCCVCRKKMLKSDMIRVAKSAEGNIFIDETGKADGRGAYICRSDECKNKLKKLKSLNRAFKCQVKDEIYEKLLKTKEI